MRSKNTYYKISEEFNRWYFSRVQVYLYCLLLLFNIIFTSLKTVVQKSLLLLMPQETNTSQWEKLFSHLAYCLSILKKSMDKQNLQISKRVEHDVQILHKYIKSLVKFNQKREKQLEKLLLELEQKDLEIQNQNKQILNLSHCIEQKQIEITEKQKTIETLKFLKKVDASYCDSIVIDGCESMLRQKQKKVLDERSTRDEQEQESDDSSSELSFSDLGQIQPMTPIDQEQKEKLMKMSEFSNKQLASRFYQNDQSSLSYIRNDCKSQHAHPLAKSQMGSEQTQATRQSQLLI